MDEKLNFSYLFGSNAPYIEELYESFLSDPNSVDEHWQQYFRDLAAQPGAVERDIPHRPIQESFANLAKRRPVAAAGIDEAMLQKQLGVLRLMTAYRIQGVGAAQLDPLKLKAPRNTEALALATHGLSDSDLSTSFAVGKTDFGGSASRLPLSEIVSKLKQTYCGHIGVEYMYINDRNERHWIRNYFESTLSTPNFGKEEKRYILKQVTAAETMERYLHTKYVGQKRFSVEGGESAIAGLNYLIQQAGKAGVEEIAIGMAHRGRLNVLINTLGKKPADLFAEFEGKVEAKLPSGDVKYHMGYSSDIATPGGTVHVTLAFNPSHLEIVNPVVEGSVRAKQARRTNGDGRDQVLPVLIHGDSAFIGLGVNQATFNMSRTRGYTTGGTIHLVINNQIGFTTSDTRDTRSTTYCTDIAKMVDAPIIHVNGDDPEALCYAVQAALEYRKTFHKDVVIDLVCFRKLGHNEGDDPTLTQPLMYRAVSQHPGTRALYAEKLVKEGVLSEAEAEALVQDYRAALDKGEHVDQIALKDQATKYRIDWSKYLGKDWREAVETGLPAAEIKRLADKVTAVPEGFGLHATAKRVINGRIEMAAGEQPVDWGMAETIAYASMVTNGIGVRISGEDSGRGTFSHRHAVLHDTNRQQHEAGIYVPLQHMADNQAPFTVYDSILNEEAVMAFEYGFASAAPEKLVIWEAQFGDFANGAQVTIDQFISSGETKWGRMCGLTTILPHGYDGQGPEHSSGRLERWLQLCSEENMQIIMPSEASQMFHILRRQVLRSYRKPLVIFMSKRLLRFKESTSPLENFVEGTAFHPVIGDTAQRADNSKVKRVILCAGQVYYDLAKGREERGLEEQVAIVRLEQLYPMPYDEAAAELAKYPGAEIMWAQEEPKNQGAWYQIRHRLERLLKDGQKLTVASRPTSSSPAVGYGSLHAAQLKQLVEDALSL